MYDDGRGVGIQGRVEWANERMHRCKEENGPNCDLIQEMHALHVLSSRFCEDVGEGKIP